MTGCAGFLGSHMADRLIAEGHQVIGLDNLLTGRMENIQHLLDHPRFTFIQGDASLPMNIEGHVDAVLHMASPASPKDYVKHRIDTLKVGAIGTYHSLEIAKAKGAVFLLTSTSEIYGDPEVNPQPESYWGHVNSIGPRSMYDESKRFAEAMTVAYFCEHKVRVRIARIFNTFGPRMRMDDGRALPNFMLQALQNEPVTVYGRGSQTRSFCYVDDLIDGLYRLVTYPKDMLPPDETPGYPLPPVVNLGNPDEVQLIQVAKEVIGITESESIITHEPLPIDDPQLRQPDIRRAQLLLGWEPKVPRQEGFRRLAEDFRARLVNGR